ncbi:DUF1801 domain-containing protein [Pelagibacterium lentulum]|uniref:YdhG-like domain-containing protein n=1 Tax=Pelagibacterium lentulum TaxID=2029865 RepID=A0A916W219_9HYPH|nr:DUF1801 domain-containing protein [Pelagibacterium lentulum]GGA60062.1 hypothetical protein GCM10011499_32870 [Pelagibacterium lentulum]
MTSPPIPKPVAESLARYSHPIRARLLEIREAIFAVAAQTEGLGPLTETLKWSEPAYLTEQSKSGTTIRLGTSKNAPDKCAVFFNCRTTLVETFRTHFSDAFEFEGNRALIVPATAQLSEGPLAHCLRAALIYHRSKGRHW